ncbi:hypothetical protein HID58_063660 [Brassica napus]|uniref:Uncharacterized protein n=1 Tax=Brassica napus TaxID=3708 RepID=A0ABQ8A4V3_BRANA|nr:hypothetical protein HID58_063660 [Brassica napus]
MAVSVACCGVSFVNAPAKLLQSSSALCFRASSSCKLNPEPALDMAVSVACCGVSFVNAPAKLLQSSSALCFRASSSCKLNPEKKKYTLRVRDEHSSNDGPQPMAFKSSPFGSSQQKKDKKPALDMAVSVACCGVSFVNAPAKLLQSSSALCFRASSSCKLNPEKKKYTLRVRDEHSSNDGPQPMAFKSSPFGSSQQKKDKKESQPTDLRQTDPAKIHDASFLDAVVKVYCTHTAPDYSLPWQKQRQFTSTGRQLSSFSDSFFYFSLCPYELIACAVLL